MNFRDKIIGFLFLLAIVIVLFRSYERKKNVQLDIEKNKLETIGKITKIVSRRSFKHIYYTYFYKNKKYESWENTNLNSKDLIDRYYLIEISSFNPEYSKILLDKEITNINEIKKAGF
ncbi:hypothetical protein B0A78_11635 [Flavobacterium columnare NBRC 100251 = ATCC 23463]|uniref:hypothetical protein n=1 Tax=Flavobacterium columnare TaxID=996 RepID=UPI000BE9A67A|nr:hypothetical protein [Flavobacterium columnare]PDS22555.1 hypothetical protein B0A78_11635 [Flavobacterium columnare NBRC 100251 = ATCC 23463]GEM59252.1 hypothetical protein FC1_24900 [Flavobacterium columnare NBRC 100251 = ATCC 23463]